MARNAKWSPTIKEVARHAGVALSSVSRVLNDHPDVSPDMRLRVLRAVDELGYEPDLLASSLRRGNTKTIGYLVADIVNPLFADILQGAERRLRAEGFSVLLAHSEGDSVRDVESMRLLRRRRIDGLIVSVADETRAETLEELARLDVPVVLLDREMEGQQGFGGVLADHRTGVRRAVEHLIDLGHRRVGLVAGRPSTRPGRERLAGFLEGFERRGLPAPDDLVVHGKLAIDFGQRAVDGLLGAPDPPTALITGGNLIFVGAISALHRREIPVGEGLSLITCDDIPLAEFHTPPITVVHRDTAAIGDLAAEIMLERLAGGPARVETVSTELLVRGSTRPLAFPSPLG